VSKTRQLRLPEPWGRRLDRNHPIAFTFEGRHYQGFRGDTLASALAANGALVISRSFKYHRPRGAFSFSGLDANAYVQVLDRPNVCADQLPLTENLAATAQNVWGSLQRDRGALTRHLARFMPVGFYYRAFFRPRGIWPLWERLLRRCAGLGRVDQQTVPGYSDKQYLFADVAVIGAGPAGLSAALAAASAGASVILIDDSPEPGGSLNYARFQSQPLEVEAVRKKLLEQLQQSTGIRVMASTTCTGWFADNWLSMHDGARLYKLRAKQVVACTGSVEQPMVFRNNDLPGVLPASGAQRLMRLYGTRPGQHIAVVASNLEGYDVARDLVEAGQAPCVFIEMNREPLDTSCLDWLNSMGVETLCGYTVLEALAGPGMRSITGIMVSEIDACGTPRGTARRISCDTLITSVGYAPLAQLVCHAGAQLVYDETLHSLKIVDCPGNAQLAGSVRHCYELEAVLRDGAIAGARAAAGAGFQGQSTSGAQKQDDPGNCRAVNHPWPIFPHKKGKDFVDFDEDQTVADLENAVADGFEHPELAKRYSTTGMGPSQGRLSSLNAMRIVQRVNQKRLDGTKVTTQRPPYKPVSFGRLAGRNFQPERLTPMHHWHLQQNATMMPAGLWQRPAFYGRRDRRELQITAEVAAVRENAGLIDVSTLGGIEVRGPDAAQFLNRMYTYSHERQEIGRTRYLLMADDTGSVIDDGVACRLAEDYFYVTTTTTGSDSVYRSMLRHIAQWRLEVDTVNVTSAYAAMNIAGPKAREIVRQLDSDIDFSRDAFPYLAGRQGRLCGVQVLAMRIGFVGELGYELHVPWSSALSIWEELAGAGESLGILPVGVEAQRILRLEKGHIIVGQDTDGLTFPEEAGLGWAVSRKKGYFIGGPAITHLTQTPVSRQLTGFVLADTGGPVPRECHLVLSGKQMTGRVTSVAYSPSLGQVIGLAYVSPEQAVTGSEFEIKVDQGQRVKAIATALPFYDPDNLRQQL
jgi:sarcosine oxidase subunit alpha